jgi:hypothetical protein
MPFQTAETRVGGESHGKQCDGKRCDEESLAHVGLIGGGRRVDVTKGYLGISGE